MSNLRLDESVWHTIKLLGIIINVTVVIGLEGENKWTATLAFIWIVAMSEQEID